MKKEHEIKEQISALESKSRRIRNQAQGRSLTQVEKSLLDDMDDEIRHLENELDALPANGPLSGPGHHLGSARTTSNRTGGFSSLGGQLQAIATAGTPSGR